MSTINKLYQIFSSLFYNIKPTGDNNNEVIKDTPVVKQSNQEDFKQSEEIENTEEMFEVDKVEADEKNAKSEKGEAKEAKGEKGEADGSIEANQEVKGRKGEAKGIKVEIETRDNKMVKGEAETVLTHKELENLYDFTFEAYCEFRSKVIENEPTIDDLTQALCVLYNNDTLSMWEVNDLLDLYNSTIQMINDYQPTNVLTWNGYEVVPPELNPITVGESITLLEFDRRAGKILDKDYNANIDFNLGLEQFAVLLRKPGEHLPIDLNKRIKFIDARKQIAKQAPLWLILNVRFFFIRKYRKSLIKSALSTYLMPMTQQQKKQLKNKSKE